MNPEIPYGGVSQSQPAPTPPRKLVDGDMMCPWMPGNRCVKDRCGIFVKINEQEGACSFCILGADALKRYLNLKDEEKKNGD